MANDPEAVERWVDERLHALDPGNDVRPDVARARWRLRQLEGDAPAGSRRAWLVALATVVLIAIVLPWPRAAAQRLWDRLMLGRVEIVRVDRPELPDSVTSVFELREREPFQVEEVHDIAAAERIAGFHPLLPATDILGGPPAMAVIRKVTLSTDPLDVKELNRALAAVDASDIAVRDEWDGTTLTVEGGPVVVARYMEAGVELMQAAPLQMNVPPGFRFDQFMELAFRVFGRNATEARDLAARLTANPALLMVLRPGHHTAVREFPLRNGSGAVIGDPDGGMCVFWSTAGRLFIVSSPKLDEQLAAAVANSIDAHAGP
ncbi:MAG TPA: hypothetical protein VFV95_17935 [Vicinamibacterales bacterium]|nr:hypothetical protein [Vicinamibacterales bacterium]